MKKRAMITSILSSVVAISCVACANVKKSTDLQSTYLTSSLYNNKIDYVSVINDYIVNDKDLSDMKYKQAVYMLLSSTNVPMSKYEEELHTMLLYSMHPGCIDDSFNTLFANLIMTLQNNELDSQVKEEMFRVYLSLAAYLHETKCHENHIKDYDPSFDDVYKCDSLEAELKRSR